MARLIFEAMNRRDFTQVAPYMDEDLVLNFPGAGNISGARKVLVFMKTLLRKFPELQFHVSEVLVEENKAVAIWTNQGKYSSGASYANSGNTLFYFKEGKITFISDYFKDTSFLTH